MKYRNILVTGGAGFVGSNLAVRLAAEYPNANIIAFDNLKRRGSELNVSRFNEVGVTFVHGDVRSKEDFIFPEKIDFILDCAAEASVLAGVTSSAEYVINTNLVGTLNCLELARRDEADIIFMSTSRVYPIGELNKINVSEHETRFVIDDNQIITGVSKSGINEEFPSTGVRSLYGATKLSSELFVQEYINSYNIKGVINRCGVITGPW